MFSTKAPVACAVVWLHPDHCRCVRVALASPQASTNDDGVSTAWRVQSYMTVRCFGAVDVVGAAVAEGTALVVVAGSAEAMVVVVVGSALVEVALVGDGVVEVVGATVA